MTPFMYINTKIANVKHTNPKDPKKGATKLKCQKMLGPTSILSVCHFSHKAAEALKRKQDFVFPGARILRKSIGLLSQQLNELMFLYLLPSITSAVN